MAMGPTGFRSGSRRRTLAPVAACVASLFVGIQLGSVTPAVAEPVVASVGSTVLRGSAHGGEGSMTGSGLPSVSYGRIALQPMPCDALSGQTFTNGVASVAVPKPTPTTPTPLTTGKVQNT